MATTTVVGIVRMAASKVRPIARGAVELNKGTARARRGPRQEASSGTRARVRSARKGANGRNWPLAAVTLDRVGAAAIGGAADQNVALDSGWSPYRSRSCQGDGERVAAQDHERDQPPDSLLAVGVGADEFRDVAGWARPRSRFAGLWRPGRRARPSGLSECQPPRFAHSRALRWPSN
jgi:hypothetical protein